MPTILLVDDEPDHLELMVQLFELEGFNTVTAPNASEAMKALSGESKIDVIVSDLNMPDRTGLELLSAIRKVGLTVPFFFLTASHNLVERRALDSGATGLFYKPVSPGAIIAAIRKALTSTRTDKPIRRKKRRRRKSRTGRN